MLSVNKIAAVSHPMVACNMLHSEKMHMCSYAMWQLQRLEHHLLLPLCLGLFVVQERHAVPRSGW